MVGTYSLVVGVNEDNLVVLVDTVLVDPVRVEDTKVAASLADTLLRNTLETSLRLQVVDTLTDGLAVGSTLGDVFLAVTPADTDTVDNVALLGLVAKTARLVRTGRARRAVDHVKLTVLPAPESHKHSISNTILSQDAANAPHAEQETEDIRLLLFVQLADVL